VHTTQNHASLLQRALNTDFPDVIKFCVAVHMLWQKVIRIRHPDYDPDWAQKLISSSTSRHLSTCKMSSTSMHAFFNNLANRQTNKHRGLSHLPPPLSEVNDCKNTGRMCLRTQCKYKLYLLPITCQNSNATIR